MITNRYLTGTTNSQTENKMRDDLYPRPEGALMLSDIKKGIKIYHVYGYSDAPGEVSIEMTVFSEVMPYRETQDAKAFFKKETREKDPFFLKLVIITSSEWNDSPKAKSTHHFVSDLCLLDDRHNNNFIFADKKTGSKVRRFREIEALKARLDRASTVCYR